MQLGIILSISQSLQIRLEVMGVITCLGKMFLLMLIIGLTIVAGKEYSMDTSDVKGVNSRSNYKGRPGHQFTGQINQSADEFTSTRVKHGPQLNPFNHFTGDHLTTSRLVPTGKTTLFRSDNGDRSTTSSNNLTAGSTSNTTHSLIKKLWKVFDKGSAIHSRWINRRSSATPTISTTMKTAFKPGKNDLQITDTHSQEATLHSYDGIFSSSISHKPPPNETISGNMGRQDIRLTTRKPSFEQDFFVSTLKPTFKNPLSHFISKFDDDHVILYEDFEDNSTETDTLSTIHIMADGASKKPENVQGVQSPETQDFTDYANSADDRALLDSTTSFSDKGYIKSIHSVSRPPVKSQDFLHSTTPLPEEKHDTSIVSMLKPTFKDPLTHFISRFDDDHVILYEEFEDNSTETDNLSTIHIMADGASKKPENVQGVQSPESQDFTDYANSADDRALLDSTTSLFSDEGYIKSIHNVSRPPVKSPLSHFIYKIHDDLSTHEHFENNSKTDVLSTIHNTMPEQKGDERQVQKSGTQDSSISKHTSKMDGTTITNPFHIMITTTSMEPANIETAVNYSVFDDKPVTSEVIGIKTTEIQLPVEETFATATAYPNVADKNTDNMPDTTASFEEIKQLYTKLLPTVSSQTTSKGWIPDSHPKTSSLTTKSNMLLSIPSLEKNETTFSQVTSPEDEMKTTVSYKFTFESTNELRFHKNNSLIVSSSPNKEQPMLRTTESMLASRMAQTSDQTNAYFDSGLTDKRSSRAKEPKSSAKVVGVVLGTIIALIIVGTLVFYVYKRRRTQRSEDIALLEQGNISQNSTAAANPSCT